MWFNGTEQLITDRSIAQGQRFDGLTLTANRNRAFGGGPVVVPTEGALPSTTLEHGAVVTFLSPDDERLERLRNRWSRALSTSTTRGSEDPGADLALFAAALDEGEQDDADVEAERGESGGPPKWGSDRSVPNGSSIAFLFEYGGRCLLFSGDAHAEVLEQSITKLLDQRGLDRLRLDAFKVPHHGSVNNLTPQLLALLHCARVLISTDRSRHGHPNAPVVELLAATFPGATIAVNHDNPDVRGRVDAAPNVVFPHGSSFVVVD